MFHNWTCIINGEVAWTCEITDIEAYGEACFYAGRNPNSDVLLDVQHFRLLVGHYDLG